MPRYIDADKLESLRDIMADKCDGIGESIWNQFRTTVEWTPTVDAVEVVRCRECKHAHMLTFENGIHCLSCNYQNAHGMLVENHGFCYWGERREDGHKHSI